MGKKILIDTDLLISKKISIMEYIVAYLTSLGSEGFFQLARYNREFVIDESIVLACEEKGLVSYAKGREDDQIKTIFSIESNDGFVVLSEKDSINSWIEEWVNLWPKGIKSGGYRVRPSVQEAAQKMRKFRNIYKEFDKETIMEATKDYINGFAVNGYSYMKIAKYFILKDGESTLADECSSFMDDKHNPVIQKVSYGEDEL